MEALPSNKLEEIKAQLSAASNDQAKISEIFKSFFTEEQIQQSIENATKEGISGYISAIDDTLTDLQRESLEKVFEKYNSVPPAPLLSAP